MDVFGSRTFLSGRTLNTFSLQVPSVILAIHDDHDIEPSPSASIACTAARHAATYPTHSRAEAHQSTSTPTESTRTISTADLSYPLCRFLHCNAPPLPRLTMRWIAVH